MSKPLYCPWIVYLPLNARSECVAPSDLPLGGVRRDHVHVPRGLAGVPPAGLEADARIGRRRGRRDDRRHRLRHHRRRRRRWRRRSAASAASAGRGRAGGRRAGRRPRPAAAAAAGAGGGGGGRRRRRRRRGRWRGRRVPPAGAAGAAAGGGAVFDVLPHAAMPNAHRERDRRRRNRSIRLLMRLVIPLSFGAAAVLQHLVHAIDLDRLIGLARRSRT